MSANEIDDADMADRLNKRLKHKNLSIDRTSVSRIRRGKQWPSRDYHAAIFDETGGEVGGEPHDYTDKGDETAPKASAA